MNIRKYRKLSRNSLTLSPINSMTERYDINLIPNNQKQINEPYSGKLGLNSFPNDKF